MIKVYNGQDHWDISSPDNLEALIVEKRNSPINQFILSHDDEEYPAMFLLVKGNIAHVNYLTEDRHPGCVSLGQVPGLEVLESTIFSISMHRADDVSLPNEQVIPFPQAIEAAKEFCVSKERPKCVEWFEL